MESSAALKRLSAPDHRVAVLRLLIEAGPEGVAVGAIARSLGVMSKSLSAPLTLLVDAGLVMSRREGRSVIYAADIDGMTELLLALVEERSRVTRFDRPGSQVDGANGHPS